MSTANHEPTPPAGPESRPQQGLLLLGVIVVAVVAVILVMLSQRPAPLSLPSPEAETVDATSPSPSAEAAGVETAEATAAEAEAEGTAIAAATVETEATVVQSGPYAGIERGTSAEGMPRLGPAAAPMVIYEYGSYGCGHCANFHDGQFPQLLDEMRAGRLTFVYVPVSDTFAAPATAAAFCAHDQGRFWEMHDLLFTWLRQYGGSAYPLDRLLEGATQLGLDQEVFSECLMSEDIVNRLNDANGLFLALADQYPGEVTGTPTLTLNGIPPETAPGHRSGAPSIDVLRSAIAAVNP